MTTTFSVLLIALAHGTSARSLGPGPSNVAEGMSARASSAPVPAAFLAALLCTAELAMLLCFAPLSRLCVQMCECS